jgi:hypothetical protein
MTLTRYGHSQKIWKHSLWEQINQVVKPVLEVTFGTRKKWSFKTGDLLKEVKYIWNFQWLDKQKVTTWVGLTLDLFCFVCRCLVSCVPNVASFSWLSILDFLFGFCNSNVCSSAYCGLRWCLAYEVLLLDWICNGYFINGRYIIMLIH